MNDISFKMILFALLTSLSTCQCAGPNNSLPIPRPPTAKELALDLSEQPGKKLDLRDTHRRALEGTLTVFTFTEDQEDIPGGGACVVLRSEPGERMACLTAYHVVNYLYNAREDHLILVTTDITEEILLVPMVPGPTHRNADLAI